MDALRASTAFLPDVSNHHRRDGDGDQGERAVCYCRLRYLHGTRARKHGPLLLLAVS
jgi:hypothetical protein